MVRDAIRKGWITWHAFPFNGQMEMFDSSLLEFAVQLVHDLDEEFELPPKHTLSQVSQSLVFIRQRIFSKHLLLPHT